MASETVAWRGGVSVGGKESKKSVLAMNAADKEGEGGTTGHSRRGAGRAMCKPRMGEMRRRGWPACPTSRMSKDGIA